MPQQDTDIRPPRSISGRLREGKSRWVPITWQVGGSIISFGGFLMGTNNLLEMEMHIGILSFLTAVYLSIIVYDRREPQDALMIAVYLLYAIAFTVISIPEYYDIGGKLPSVSGISALALFALLPVLWYLYIYYVADIDSRDDPDGA